MEFESDQESDQVFLTDDECDCRYCRGEREGQSNATESLSNQSESSDGQSSQSSSEWSTQYCSECNRQFQSSTSLNQHLTHHTRHSNPSFCEYCNEEYDNDYHYRSHDCLFADWCENCMEFHERTSNQPPELVDNSNLQIKDQEGGLLDMTCLVCLSKMRSRLFLPCAHLVCCADCSKSVLGCPVCRSIIVKIENVILS
jgi:Zinc finger, C3HC4 type (RING finger)